MRRGLTAGRVLALLLGGTAVLGTLAPQAVQGASNALPRIRHVWVVMLENEGYQSAFQTNPNPYLPNLPKQGALISKYFGTAHQSLPNYIGLVGGESPTVENQADCPYYVDINSKGSADATPGQTGGHGCVYPPSRITVVDQLAGLGYRWKGYMEDLMNDPHRDSPVTCNPQVTATGTQDTTQSAQGPPNIPDQYAARHDPFMYFHSIIDNDAQCSNVVTLQSDSNGLRHDLMTISSTPNFSLVVPNLCDDGHDPSSTSPSGSCAAPDVKGDSTGGLTSIDHWLSVYIPMILGSPAYQQDGMVVVAFDEASTSDANPCCNEHPGPNTQFAGGSGQGGGQVGAVVLSPFIKPGTVTASSYNHYSLLKTVEDIFHTTGGDDGHGHLGYASDDAPGQAPRDPGRFGADIFTNPNYVPPPPPPPGTFYFPPPLPQVIPPAGTPAGPPKPEGQVSVTGSAATSTTTIGGPSATSSPTPAHWDHSMLASLPGQPGGMEALAEFVLVPLLVTGAVTFFLRKKG